MILVFNLKNAHLPQENMLFSASFNDLVTAKRCLLDVSSWARNISVWVTNGWCPPLTREASCPGVSNLKQGALRAAPVPVGSHSRSRPLLSLPVSLCTVPTESPVASCHCCAHLPYFAIALGQTEISWSSQHVFLFVNGLKLRKHWKSTVLGGKRKYRGFVPARKRGTKLSPRVIYYPFQRAGSRIATRQFAPLGLQTTPNSLIQVQLKFFAR